MTRSNASLLFVIVIAGAPLTMRAGSNNASFGEPRKATEEIKRMKTDAAIVVDHADLLGGMIINNTFSRDSELTQLITLKDNINMIGRELQSLDDNRASLAPWQMQAADQVRPLLKEAANETNEAIESFQENSLHLWSPQYRAKVTTIRSDSDQITHTLKDYLALAKSRGKGEQRLTQEINTSTTSTNREMGDISYAGGTK